MDCRRHSLSLVAPHVYDYESCYIAVDTRQENVLFFQSVRETFAVTKTRYAAGRYHVCK